ncbi:MAG: hypothetical protein WD834_03740 [Actinomycetota bacterium]
MKKTAVLLAMVLISAIFAVPAQAHRGHARPQITRFQFVDRPLKAGALERLIVIAHDPDSWISEIQVQWEDDNQSGGVIFAHTYCVQDPEFERPGTPAKLKLDITFEDAGDHHVEVRAISEIRCEGGNDVRFSRTLEKDVTAEDPRRSFPDPDDTGGPLDVLGAEQTIGGDEQGLENHIVHAPTMAGDLGPSPLGGAQDHVEFSFDTDGDASTYERTLLVDAGNSGILSAQMKDADGAVVGDATVTVDGASLSVDFAKRLLGRGTDRYGWTAVTHDASSPNCTAVSPCLDRVPDTGTYLHVV